MNDTRTAIPMGLKHILDAIYADPEVHLPELMDWVDRMYPEAGPSGSVTYALLKQACSDRTGGLYRWLGSLFRDIDAQTLYHLSENYILHADWTGHHAAAAADSRTVTCLVDDGPKVFGQRCDTILSFDALDAVVTEERERDIHRFLIAVVLFPLMGYGVWWLIPRLREQGRSSQRKVAFYANCIGYVGCAAYGWIRGTASARMFFNAYFFTVLLLTIANALLHVRASGHAAGASSPIVFSWLFAGPVWSIAYVIAFGLSVWSSLVLKRHKKTDILAGVACMLTGFLLSFSLAVMSGWLP